MYDKTPGQILEYHRSMLADTTRTARLAQAIAQVVAPGDVVLDLGCGTGILAFLACRAGAARVYAIEMGPVIEIARTLCRDNGLQDRIVFFEELSTRVSLPQPVDVIVTETIGNFGVDEGILGSLIDARTRFLKPGGQIIPRTLELWAAPVELPGVYQGLDLWMQDLHGLDFSAVRTLAVNNLHWVDLPVESLLSAPCRLQHMDLAAVTASDLRGQASFTAARAGTMHGLAGWFASELAAGTALTNAPPAEVPNWRQAFLPLRQPVQLFAGDQVTIDVRASANGGLWRWRVTCIRPGTEGMPDTTIAAFDQSTLFGQLLSRNALHKRGTNYVPDLSEKGRADLAILQAMNGTQTVADIARWFMQTFPNRFADERAALEHVRNLSQKYSQP